MNGLFIGTFDPFTGGHLEIVEQASKLLNVVICIARNPKKIRTFSEFTVAAQIRTATNCTVVTSDKLTPDIMEEYNCDYIIRGVRNVSDMLYEDALFQQYKLINPKIKAIYFTTDSPISSSFVRELYTRNKSWEKYAPNAYLLRSEV